MASRTKVFTYAEAIWLIVIALGAWYTVVQFGYTVIQLYTPLLYKET
ncbi:MAG: hypothetical protein ACLP5V_06075 [Candidatus Bathyarchaeia archaeon]